MAWKVPYVDLPKHFKIHENELMSEIKRVMSNGSFILRDDVANFEKNVAEFMNVKHVVGVNSGTDALYLAVRALNLKEGDEVITVAQSFVATIAAIVFAGAKPVLVDINEDFNMDASKLEAAITSKTKAIIPVHLNGRVCDMGTIMAIAKKHDLKIVEDACQSFGSKFKEGYSGSFGEAGCFSTHPMKTLHGAGDGGFITTNDDTFADKLRMLRNHGQKTKTDLEGYGFNSRLDNLQAAILNVKFKFMNEWIEKRRAIASLYNEKLSDLPITLPPAPETGDYFDTYNSYVIRSGKRDALRDYLVDKGIEVFAHMPTPLYYHESLNLKGYKLETNERVCSEILSLPVYPELENSQQNYVIESIREFFKEQM